MDTRQIKPILRVHNNTVFGLTRALSVFTNSRLSFLRSTNSCAADTTVRLNQLHISHGICLARIMWLEFWFHLVVIVRALLLTLDLILSVVVFFVSEIMFFTVSLKALFATGKGFGISSRQSKSLLNFLVNMKSKCFGIKGIAYKFGNINISRLCHII